MAIVEFSRPHSAHVHKSLSKAAWRIVGLPTRIAPLWFIVPILAFKRHPLLVKCFTSSLCQEAAIVTYHPLHPWLKSQLHIATTSIQGNLTSRLELPVTTTLKWSQTHYQPCRWLRSSRTDTDSGLLVIIYSWKGQLLTLNPRRFQLSSCNRPSLMWSSSFHWQLLRSWTFLKPLWSSHSLKLTFQRSHKWLKS